MIRCPKCGFKMSALNAAAKELGEAGKPMTSKAMIQEMAVKGYWTSPSGLTPWKTLSTAINREIAKKSAKARFAKAGPGLFTLS